MYIGKQINNNSTVINVGVEKPKTYACPKCKSSEVSRMYAGFYAKVDAETGDDLSRNFGNHESSTELTDECSCDDCDHEWRLGDD